METTTPQSKPEGKNKSKLVGKLMLGLFPIIAVVVGLMMWNHIHSQDPAQAQLAALEDSNKNLHLAVTKQGKDLKTQEDALKAVILFLSGSQPATTPAPAPSTTPTPISPKPQSPHP
jgi:cytoskeletal protein RodZ